MTSRQADLSIASLFYFQSKMPDEGLKKRFAQYLVKNVLEHSVSDKHRIAPDNEYFQQIGAKTKKIERDRICNSTYSQVYGDKNCSTHLSWMLTYAAKLICAEKLDGGDNPYKSYFAPYADYMFDSCESGARFAQNRPKIVTVEDKFSFPNPFRRKPKNEKLLDEIKQNVKDVFQAQNDPIAQVIPCYGEERCMNEFQKNIDTFVFLTTPALEAYWHEKGLEIPLIKKHLAVA